MANPEHLKILKQGVEAWNAWRKEQKNDPIDLNDADLSGANLSYAKLYGAHLNFADFSGADLSDIDLRSAYLTGANLSGAKLYRAHLNDADLSDADLRSADLWDANLRDAFLTGANLSGAKLYRAHLSGAHLSDADRRDSNRAFAFLSRAKLKKTDLSEAQIGGTTFSNVDLSEVTGLDTVVHRGPSTVGIDTLYKSQGRIPDKFLRDVGVPEEIIDIARSIRCGPPIQWHSCFISYSTKDEEFARRLHSRMREANMRVWFAPEDLKGGRKLPEQIFEAIQLQDKLILLLSDASILSDWVISEVRAALAIEKKENRRKLFPIRLVDFQTLKEWKCFDSDTGKDLAKEVREYFIPDFSNWKDHDSFEKAFARLQKDLKAEDKPPQSRL